MSPIFALLWGDPARAGAVAAGLDRAAWHVIDHDGGQHRLRPSLFRRASDGGWDVPTDLLQTWRASHHRSAMRALAQQAALAQIGKALQAGGVPAAVLKGGTFVWSAGFDPALRPMRDCDVLIRPGDAATATGLLEAIGFVSGTQAPPSGKHLPAMTRGQVAVELHLTIFDSFDEHAKARDQQFITRAWQRAVPTAFAGMQAFCAADTLLHLILHAVRDHQFNNGPLLLTDMLTLVAGGAIDWEVFWDEAKWLGVTRACQLALGFGEQVCALTVDWQGHAPNDLGAAEMEQVARLMLVDLTYRAALGWPGQLLRMAPRRWPGQLAAMVRRHRGVGAERSKPQGEASLGAALSYALGAEGRSKIADAVNLSRWLKRR